MNAIGYDPYKPTISFPGGMSINVTAEQLAEGFWSLPSDEMADFFAHLDRVAKYMLCLQMAAVVREIQERADKYDHDALHGFQTMLSHAQAYVETATDYRISNAKMELTRMVHGIKTGAKTP